MMSNELPTTDLAPSDIIKKLELGEFSLTVKSESRSKVWLVFARIRKPDGELIPDYTLCKTCWKLFKYNIKTTSNLVKHRCYMDFVRGERASLPADENSMFESDEQLYDENKKITNLSMLLTKWIIKEYQSYNLLQSEGLRTVLQEMARLGSIFGGDIDIARLMPSIADVTENIDEIYKPCFEQVKSEITLKKDHGFALTCDIRNVNLTKQNYLLLTAHYMDNNVPNVRFLGLRKLEDENITSQHILQNIEEILSDFDCALSSQFVLVADSSRDFFKHVSNAQTLPCISQLLSNALFRAMQEIPEIMELITNCSILVNFLTKHGKESVFGGSLKNAQHNPWLAMFNMLHSIQKNWNNIENLLQIMKEKELILSVRVSHLEAVVEALQPFEEALETLEDESVPTLHLVIMYLHELKKSCDTTDNELQYVKFIKKLKENLRNDLEIIETDNITILHKLALFLYPLTKKLLQFNDVEKKLIEDECKHLMQNYKCEMVTHIPKKEFDSPTGSPACKRRTLLSDFIESEEQDPDELFNQEIQFYKSARVVNKSDFNVFNWWQMQKDNFPLLSRLCCTVLTIPATCAASKRILASGSSLLTGKTVRFTQEADLEKIMFINSNARNQDKFIYKLESKAN